MRINRFRDQLDDRYAKMEELVRYLERTLARNQPGRVRVARIKGKVYYYQVDNNKDRNGTMIPPSDTGRIRRLVRKAYYEKVYESASAELELLGKLIAKYPKLSAEEIYGNLSEERRSWIDPILLPDDEYAAEWEAKEYKRKIITEGTPFYMTLKGDMVRSKSKQIIADRLYSKGIPYRYECALQLRTGTIHPDFTILRLNDREEIYLELWEGLDDPERADMLAERSGNYALDGILPGERLFQMYETRRHPLDTAMLDRLIDQVFR